jgi:hypothetical protein
MQAHVRKLRRVCRGRSVSSGEGAALPVESEKKLRRASSIPKPVNSRPEKMRQARDMPRPLDGAMFPMPKFGVVETELARRGKLPRPHGFPEWQSPKPPSFGKSILPASTTSSDTTAFADVYEACKVSVYALGDRLMTFDGLHSMWRPSTPFYVTLGF